MNCDLFKGLFAVTDLFGPPRHPMMCFFFRSQRSICLLLFELVRRKFAELWRKLQEEEKREYL